MSHITITHPLDWGNHYQLRLDYDTNTQKTTSRVDGPNGAMGTVERHLRTLIKVNAGDGVITVRLGGKTENDGEAYGKYWIHNGKVARSEINQRLTVFETRMLGNERLYRWLPYSRENIDTPLQRTDLHTHSSAQISARGLIEVACKHHIPYPIRLLDNLHKE